MNYSFAQTFPNVGHSVLLEIYVCAIENSKRTWPHLQEHTISGNFGNVGII